MLWIASLTLAMTTERVRPLILEERRAPEQAELCEVVANGAKEARVSKDEADIGASWFETA